jgi:hypothetical protein
VLFKDVIKLRLYTDSNRLINEHGGQRGWYWQGKTEISEANPVAVSLRTSQIPHILVLKTGLRNGRPATKHLNRDVRPSGLKSPLHCRIWTPLPTLPGTRGKESYISPILISLFSLFFNVVRLNLHICQNPVIHWDRCKYRWIATDCYFRVFSNSVSRSLLFIRASVLSDFDKQNEQRTPEIWKEKRLCATFATKENSFMQRISYIYVQQFQDNF